jgi:hypothetical protein
MLRRHFLASAFLPLLSNRHPSSFFSPGAIPVDNAAVRVFIPKTYSPDLSETMLSSIHGATLQYLADTFGTRNLPLWKKPLHDIDMGFRLQVSIDHIARSVRLHQETYPIDPVWVVSQILAESYFFDGAVSSAMAVGLCQIIPATAREYGLLVAADKPEHRFEPYAHPELSAALHAYEQVIKERQRIVRTERPKNEPTQEEAVRAIAGNSIDVLLPRAQASVAYRDKLKALDETIKQLRADSKTYLDANYAVNGGGHPITNTAFFDGFDHRFMHDKAIPVMVAMLTKALSKRGGNILVAAAAYNAGLSTTVFDERHYAAYGRIPAYEETTRYISRILGNYHEIYSRIAST